MAESLPDGRTCAVLYDGNCRTCVRLAGTLRRLDRRKIFWIVPSNDPEVAARFPEIGADAFQRALQLVGPEGERQEGSQAIARILDLLPGGSGPARLFTLPIIGPLLDRGYRWFARNRTTFGCGDHCALPAAPGGGTAG